VADSSAREAFGRYRGLIESLLRPAAADPRFSFTAEREHPISVQVERGMIFPAMLIDAVPAASTLAIVEPLIAVSTAAQLASLTVADQSAHHRPLYRPLLVYSWLQAFGLAYETLPRGEFGRWEEGSRAWCDDLERRLGEFVWPAGELPAPQGDLVAEACWTGLALHVAGKLFIRDAWTDLAADVFGKIARRRQPSGRWLASALSDNPEVLWFHELAILHAAASYAVQSEDRALAAAIRQATAALAAEVQPDHATNEPWALFAFIWNPQTRPLADGMLHATQSVAGLSTAGGGGRGGSGIVLMLLTDALYCLRLFGS